MTRRDPTDLKLYTFPAMFPGLPSAGPFGIKLEACLRMMKVPYTRVYEGDNRKGPKRKSPWIVDGDVKMGDSELILDYLRRTYGATIDDELTPAQRAQSLLYRHALEEHVHQVFEYELICLDAGWSVMAKEIKKAVPGVLAPVIIPMIRRKWSGHIFERGIARHSPAEVEALGKADIDALATIVAEREWLVADHPTKVDASAFGLLGVTVWAGLETPVCQHARTLTPLVRYLERCRAHWFPELADKAAAA